MSKLKEMKKQKEQAEGGGMLYTILAVLVVVAGIAVVALFLLNPRPSIDLAKLEAGGQTRGNENAKVSIVEFSDFQCPACGQAYPAVERAFSQYSDKVKFTYRHFPLSSLHPYAQKAAEASECASEQRKFWEMYDKLFQNQQNLKISDLKQYATDIGLDSAQFNSCLDTGKYASKVASDYSFALSIGLNSTPTFFINGEKYASVMSFDQLKALIDAKLG